MSDLTLSRVSHSRHMPDAVEASIGGHSIVFRPAGNLFAANSSNDPEDDSYDKISVWTCGECFAVVSDTFFHRPHDDGAIAGHTLWHHRTRAAMAVQS